MPADTGRDFIRRASGNELKVLLAIRYLEDEGKPTTADAISAEAMLNRATVYRLLPRLAANQWVEYRLTADGRLMANYALTELVRPAISNITDTPGAETKCLPSNDTGPTGVANRDSSSRVNPSQKATESHNATVSERGRSAQQLTGTKDSTGCASPYARRAKDLARQTARALDDLHSLGFHIQTWYDALKLDEATSSRANENALLNLVNELIERWGRTGKRQGAAFTVRARAIIKTAREERNNRT